MYCNKKNVKKKHIITNQRFTDAVGQMYSVKKVFLEILQNSQENTCARASLLIKLIKKETPAQVFSREFCEIFKNVFF